MAICKGVMWRIAPGLRIVDLTHEAPVYDVRAASRLLEGTAPWYPPGTVFLTVVDPGVGTERKPVVLETKAGHYFVGPDNGVFSGALRSEGFAEARVIENKDYMLPTVSGTFHGRDVFSPAAARLAAGAPLDSFGPRLEDIVRLPDVRPSFSAGVLKGTVDFIEQPYGNVITDIPAPMLEQAGLAFGDTLSVSVGPQTFELPYRKTFGDVPVGADVAVVSSRGRLCLSVNQGDFARAHLVAAGQAVRARKAAP